MELSSLPIGGKPWRGEMSRALLGICWVGSPLPFRVGTQAGRSGSCLYEPQLGEGEPPATLLSDREPYYCLSWISYKSLFSPQTAWAGSSILLT